MVNLHHFHHVDQAPKDMTLMDLANWHINDVVYVRTVRTVDGDRFAVYAADGTHLETVGTMAEIYAATSDHDMDVATLN